MKTIFTLEDIKNIIEIIFNGNLKAHPLESDTAYKNKNSETIEIINESTGSKTYTDLARYLNISFYTWRNRIVETDNKAYKSTPLTSFDEWIESLNDIMRRTYGLVEFVNESVTASEDIDFGVKTAQVTFLVQVDKIKNLEYYVNKIKRNYLGNPQSVLDANGDNVQCYFLFGSLVYGDEPMRTQFGECITATMNLKMCYLSNAYTYSNTRFELSIDGTNYYTVPITKITLQKVFVTKAQPIQSRLDLTGVLVTSISGSWSLTYYDFNKTLNGLLDDIFWRLTAYSIDGVITTPEEVNIPIWAKVVRDVNLDGTENKVYIYKLVITDMVKTLVNNDYTTSTLSLKNYSKL